jgi:hypothetical protein
MSRRDLIGASLAAVGGVFLGQRWYQRGRGLLVPGGFTDLPGTDYRLVATSPARDTVSLYLPGDPVPSWVLDIQGEGKGWATFQTPVMVTRHGKPVGKYGTRVTVRALNPLRDGESLVFVDGSQDCNLVCRGAPTHWINPRV